MYAEILSAISSAKALLEILKTANGLANSNELVAAVYEVNTKLLEATDVALASQKKQSELTSRIAELESELRSIEDWRHQLDRYHLFQFQTGALVYAVREGMQNGEPVHYLCANCFDKKQKSILQPAGRLFVCPSCDYRIAFEQAKPSQRRGGDSWLSGRYWS